ncbi:hypothetical protein ABZS63_41830, partial [Streptomyces sp. NPDC005568]
MNHTHRTLHTRADDTAVAALRARLDARLGGAARAWLDQALDEAADHPGTHGHPRQLANVMDDVAGHKELTQDVYLELLNEAP